MAALGTRIDSDASALTSGPERTGDQARVLERENANGAMEYRERLEFALEATGTGTWTFDKDAGTLELDRRMAALLGTKRGRIGLQDLSDVLVPEDAEVLLAERMRDGNAGSR